MASVRAGRDVRGAMNDLPIPGQPDFDLNTMKLNTPAPAPAPTIGAAPAPANVNMTPLPGSPVVNSPAGPPVPANLVTPYDYRPDGVTPPTLDDKINRIMVPEPAVFPQAGTPSAPEDLGYGTGGPTPDTTPAKGGGGGGGGGGGVNYGTAELGGNFKTIPPVQNKAVAAGAGVDGSTLAKWAAALGIPIGVAAIMWARKGRRGGAPAQSEVDKALSTAGQEVAPEAGAHTDAAAAADTADAKHPYPDDTVANATDEARVRVANSTGEAVPTTSTGTPTEATQASTQRQIDIDSGAITPNQYKSGEMPTPGTEGYKNYIKFKAANTRLGKGKPTAADIEFLKGLKALKE